MHRFTKDWPDIRDMEDLSPEDQLLFKRAFEEPGVLRTFNRVCREYLTELWPTPDNPCPQALIHISAFTLVVTRLHENNTVNGAKRQATLLNGDGNYMAFQGEAGKGFNNGVTEARFYNGPLMENAFYLLSQFDDVIQRIEEKMSDEDGLDERRIREYFAQKRFNP